MGRGPLWRRGGRKSNCIPGLVVILEGVTLISPLVVYIKRHAFFKEKKKKTLRSANNLLQKQHMLSEICICGALNGPL